ncbi:MAG TPA: MaoC family dehydratase N-terminal domain-containing protein [Candidatus Binatia bacterium]|nr:MaoC family dehydratase N-terminal domain-containing protein [Candidatus Binatia bacterium]
MAENPNQALVGKEGPPATIHVDKARIRQFARAIGLNDPVYFDEAEAKRRGYPSLIGPPTLPIALGQDADPGAGSGPQVKWDVRKLLHEGTEIVYDRPIFAGDVLTMKGSLKSITTREGKSGVRTIYTMENAFYDQQGKRVCSLLIRTSEGQ